jgi:TolB-like protein/Tfp pilus assembly protein PilF
MIGKTIAHYKILEKLGEGGMGIVYRAEDTKLKRHVALKFLPAEYTGDIKAKQRFLQEAQTASSLDHPNICTIHEINESDDGNMFIVMTCYDGKSLKDLVSEGSLDIEHALHVAIQIAEGLARAHDKQITHRDIKPANILIPKGGQVKILDFGLAKLTGQAKLTRTGTTVGTVAYMSPEQARGEEVDHRTDIWSLGVIIYEMLTGVLPFTGDYEQAVIYSLLNEHPAKLSQIQPSVPTHIERIVETAMEKEKDKRYRQMDDFLADLISARKKIGALDMQQGISEKEDTPSIAVLPFVNMSPDPENEYFGDGLAEELLNALTRLEGVRVAARTSAFCFRGKDVDIREIGSKLDVTTVLEGSVRKAGNKIRVTAQLINIADGYHLWSERYDREMDDIFELQDEITLAIMEQLKIKLLPDKTDVPVVKRFTENLEAYSQLLQGRYHWHSLTAEGWIKSREYFKKAVELDPNYALAHAWLSVWLQSQTFWGDVPPAGTYQRGLESVKKALRIDDSLGMAHGVLAVIYWAYNWNWAAAELEFKRSLELEPDSALGRANYALFLMVLGRFDEALEQANMAQKLDPLSTVVNTWVGMVPLYTGRVDEAIRQLKKVIEMDPNYWQPYAHITSAYFDKSMSKEAVASAEKAVELSGGASVGRMLLVLAYHQAGRVHDSEEQLDQLKRKARDVYVSPMLFAWIYTARGDVEEAYRWLKKAVDGRDAWTSWYKMGALSRVHITDARSLELLKPVGL